MRAWTRRAVAAAILISGVGAAGCTGTGGGVARGVAPDGGCPGGGCGAGGGGLAGGREGGGHYRNWVDPCWPERYNAVARAEVLAPFAMQVSNGQVMNQTVWDWYFETEPGKEPGSTILTDRLNTAGKAKLDSISRSRPAPDTRIYIQAARNPDTGANLGDVEKERDLNSRRAGAILKYMANQPGVPVAYEVYVHDPAPMGVSAEFLAGAYRGQRQGYRGGVQSGPIFAQSTGSGNPTPTTIINNTGPAGSAGGGGSAGGSPGPGGSAGPGPGPGGP